MHAKFPELFQAAKARFDHANVEPGQTVLVVGDTGTYQPLFEAVSLAATACGAQVHQLIHPALEQPFDDVPPLVEEAIKQADYTFTLSSVAWYYNESSERMRGYTRTSGRRMWRWEGREEAVGHFLALLPGNQDLIKRSEHADKLLLNVRTIRITSRAGTDLTMERGDPERQIMNNAPGQVNYSPLTIDQRMALARGEALDPPPAVSGTLMLEGAYRTLGPGWGIQKSLIRQPVRIEVEAGRIISIARATPEGIFLDDWFRSWNDPATTYIDHFNLGLDHRIRLEYLDNLAVHFNYGGLLMGFGVHFSSNRGDLGVFRSKGHIELHHTGANLFFDNQQLLEDGEFTEASGLRTSGDRFAGNPSPFYEVEGHVLPQGPRAELI
jgi:hypothetical protein